MSASANTYKPDSIWVVIPAFNEAEVIQTVVSEVAGIYPNVIVVDDGSSDQTYRNALAGGATVIRHPINLGQGAALQTGVSYALELDADLIVTFDADGQHRVVDVQGMIEQLRTAAADVALGSRFLGSAIDMPRSRRVVLKLAILFTMITSGLRLTDAHNGLRVLTRKAASAIYIRQNRMAHASEIVAQIARLKLKFIEVPITIVYTEYSVRRGQRLGNIISILNDLFVHRIQK